MSSPEKRFQEHSHKHINTQYVYIHIYVHIEYGSMKSVGFDWLM